jgi:hypothetical protein
MVYSVLISNFKLEPKKKNRLSTKENKARPNPYPVLNVKRNSNQRKYRLWM